MEDKKDILKDIKTCELLEELKHREGVINTIMVPNEAKIEMTVEGPSIVLVVID